MTVTTLIGSVMFAIGSAGAAPDDKSYTASVDLGRVCTTDTTTLTFTFHNTSATSTQKIRGVRVLAPAGYSVGAVATPVASGGETWVSSFSGNTVTAIADNAGTGTDQGILPVETVSVAVTITAPGSTGSSTFVTVADQNSNFSGGGNAFVNVGSDPVVAAVDCELVLTASPDPVAAGSPVTIDAAVVDTGNPGAGPVLSYSGTLVFAVSPATAGCASPSSGSTTITAGAGSFGLIALSGIGSADACSVDGVTKWLTDTVTFHVQGSAALCAQAQANCHTGTEVSANSSTSAFVSCFNCKLPTTLVADYLEDRCVGAEATQCSALFLAASTTTNVPYFIDVTVTGVPRGQVTIIAELDGTFVDLQSCKKAGPPCIYSVSGSGSTNTWRVLLSTDPPIGVR